MGAGLRLSYDVAVSMTINAGDPVVLTNAGGTTRVRKLTSTDITNHYTNTSIAGILGSACHDIKTDSNGYPVLSNDPPSTVNASAGVIYPLPNYASGIDVDPVTGNGRLMVQIADDNTEFYLRAATTANAAVTVTSTKVGIPVGMQVANTTEFRSNEAATGSDICGVVSGVIETDPKFNASSAECKYRVRILPTYQQYLTGIFYAS